jgi:hypothetical protein
MNYEKAVFASTSIAFAILLSGCSGKQQVSEQETAAASPPAASSSIAPRTSTTVAPTDQARQPIEQPEAKSGTQDLNGLTRVHFDEIFAVDSKGNLSPKVPVDINGVKMTPGVTFGGGVLGGFALGQAFNHDLGVRRLDNGLVQLVQYYE